MAELFNSLQNLFEGGSDKNRPLVQEVLKRDVDFEEKYEKWSKFRRAALLEEISTWFEEPQQSNIIIHRGKSSDGFIISYDKDITDGRSFQFIFEYFKWKILERNYSSYLSDSRSFVEDDAVHTIERHYLKPRIDYKIYGKQKVDQLFGNINIEFLTISNKPIEIKLIRTIYSDSLYLDALQFEGLIELLFN
ncbi:MAG: hypothetical protein IH946_02475 [Bacteroidetes bacterium]|nr:hypothetical protein [Bacteroidota bacterium]